MSRTHVRDLEWLTARVEVNPLTDCWEWVGFRNEDGYGRYGHWQDGKFHSSGAHRLALEMKLGRPIRPGLLALHACDNPPCCNPTHLWEGADADNAADRDAKGRTGSTPGELHGYAKLTWAAVRQIRFALSNGQTCAAIAREYAVDRTTVSLIKLNKTWKETVT